ncbi:MAG: hypothetical protein IJP90_00835, partial [Treponema sp.]|nr:hypothetical protein [Treponema sp.]
KSLKSALIMLFTLPGTPSIYYGDEILLDGRENSIDACRYPFDWNWEEKENSVSTRNFYKKLIFLRRNEGALKKGSFKIVAAQGNVIAFARFTLKEAIFTVCSAEDRESTVSLPLNQFNLRPRAVQADCLGSKVESSVEGSSLVIKLPPRSSFLIKLEN